MIADSPLIGKIILILVLIAIDAFCSCAEIAVISLDASELEKMAEEKNKKAERLLKFLRQPAKFLTMIQAVITLCGFLISAFTADLLALWMTGLVMEQFTHLVSAKVWHNIFLVLITFLLSYVVLVFGILLPKRLAAKRGQKLAFRMSGLLEVFWIVFSPFTALLNATTNLLLRLFGIDPNAEAVEVSEKEIRKMADAGSKKGVIDLEENEIIQNLFEFDDMAVDEFATHRTDITLLWTDETLQQWEETIHDSRHTVYPVCEETVDHVVGVLNIKDFFRFRGRTKDFIMKHAVKPAQFIPKSVKADVLFRRMKVSHNHFAVVLDEYGGMVGIVTMNDLLEQLVGDLEDDLAELAEEPKISRISKDTWKIDGGVDLEDAAEALEVELPVEDYDTFGGFVFGIYGTIPSDGTQFEVDACGLHIKILSIKEHRLESAVVCKTTGSENAAEQERSEKNEDK